MSQKNEIKEFVKKIRHAVRAEISGESSRANMHHAWNEASKELEAIIKSSIPSYSHDPRLDVIGPGTRNPIRTERKGLGELSPDKVREVVIKVQEHQMEEAHTALDRENIPRCHPDDEDTMFGFTLKKRIRLLVKQKEIENKENLAELTTKACAEALREVASRFDGDHYLWPTAEVARWLRGRADSLSPIGE